MKRQTVVLVGAIWPPRVNFADKVSLVPHLSGGGRVQGNRMNVRPSPSRATVCTHREYSVIPA